MLLSFRLTVLFLFCFSQTVIQEVLFWLQRRTSLLHASILKSNSTCSSRDLLYRQPALHRCVGDCLTDIRQGLPVNMRVRKKYRLWYFKPDTLNEFEFDFTDPIFNLCTYSWTSQVTLNPISGRSADCIKMRLLTSTHIFKALSNISAHEDWSNTPLLMFCLMIMERISQKYQNSLRYRFFSNLFLENEMNWNPCIVKPVISASVLKKINFFVMA